MTDKTDPLGVAQYAGKLTFGAAVENIAASDDNPIKRGIFIRKTSRTMAEYATKEGCHSTPLDNLRAAQPPAAPVETDEAKRMSQLAEEIEDSYQCTVIQDLMLDEADRRLIISALNMGARCSGSTSVSKTEGDGSIPSASANSACRSSAETSELAACFEEDVLRGYSPIRNFTPKERRLIAAALRAFTPVTAPAETGGLRSQGDAASQERIAIINNHLARFHQRIWDSKEQPFELFQAAAALESALFSLNKLEDDNG